MPLLDYFKSSKPNNTAATAKERLQIIVAHERADRNKPDYLPQLKRDILEVVAKYVTVSDDQVTVEFEQDGKLKILELNVTLNSD